MSAKINGQNMGLKLDKDSGKWDAVADVTDLIWTLQYIVCTLKWLCYVDAYVYFIVTYVFTVPGYRNDDFIIYGNKHAYRGHK